MMTAITPPTDDTNTIRDPLVSIVVPVYNSSKYLDICINSLISQTLKDIEIICVDDGSSDNSVDIIKEFMTKDDRISLIRHETNLGLLAGRGDGVKSAKGRYIMLIDADDYYEKNACEELYSMIKESGAEMIQFGTNVDHHPDTDQELVDFFNKFLVPCLEPLYNEEVFRGQFEGKFNWHVWNKIYDADLIKRAYETAGRKRLIFTDDLYISFFISYFCSYCLGTPKKYYNYRLGYGYTGSTDTFKQLKTTCENSWFIYNCINFLKDEGKFEEYGRYCFSDPLLQLGFCLSLWDSITDPDLRAEGKNLLMKYWDNELFRDRLLNFISAHEQPPVPNVSLPPVKDKKTKKKNIKSKFKQIKYISTQDGLNEVQRMIELISDPEVEVVSFDIFDTLLVRPVLEPLDILKLMPDLCGIGLKEFTSMRKYSDYLSIQKKGASANIDDIYEEMGKTFGIKKEILDKLKKSELETEHDLLSPRETLKAVYNAALTFNKKIIVITDTYFTKSFIRKVLWKNGYVGLYNEYISTDLGLRKDSGNLFDYVLDDLKIPPSKIVHIGDNYQSDVKMAYSKGFSTIFHSKNAERLNESVYGPYLKNLHPDCSNCITVGLYANLRYSYQDLDLKTYWSNPFQLGFYVGQFILHFSKWIIDKMKDGGYKKLVLCYRDGYLIQKAISEIGKYIDIGFTMDEIHLPRYLRHSFYSEKGGLLRSLSEMGISKTMTVGEFISHRMYVDDPILANKAFSLFEKCGFHSLSENNIDFTKLYPVIKELDEIYYESTRTYNENVREYVKMKLGAEKTMVFDVGYRGSISNFCSEFLNIDIPELQMFANTGIFFTNSQKMVESYVSYPTKIAVDASIMELLFENIISSQEPELIGVDIIEGKNYRYRYGSYPPGNRDIDIVQDGVMRYISYSMSILKERLRNTKYDPYFEWGILVDYLCNPESNSASVISRLNRPDSSQIKGANGDDPFGGWFFVRTSKMYKTLKKVLK